MEMGEAEVPDDVEASFMNISEHEVLAGYSKNLRKPANVGDRRFPGPKVAYRGGWYHFTFGYTTDTTNYVLL